MDNKINKITIIEDGWVYIDFNDNTAQGLGDIGVDVEIIDERSFWEKLINFIKVH